MSDIQTSSRVTAEGWDAPGEVLMTIAREDGRIAKVLHDDGLENWYKVEKLTVEADAGKVRFIRR